MKKLKGVAGGIGYLLLALIFLAGAGGMATVPNLALAERAFIVIVTIIAVVCLFAKAIGVVRDAWKKE
ncbi:MAG: hypothetical protein WC445_02480 [Patescibacteria group bacterium]